ncbi:MAG TPA: hypothetical protein VHF24_01910 [Acidimicrobiales bacterium]|nr:hypothetical protein [Acidimicrobiales bacterium]
MSPEQSFRHANGWTRTGDVGVAIFGTTRVLKLLDEDFRGEHLEYSWVATAVSLAVLAVGLFLSARLRRRRP